MNAQASRIAVMAPAGETPESWAKHKIEVQAAVWRADAKAYRRGWSAFLGWTSCATLAAQVWGPAIVAWIMAHVSVDSMKVVGVVAVGAILIYGAVEALRGGLQAVRRNKRKAVSA